MRLTPRTAAAAFLAVGVLALSAAFLTGCKKAEARKEGEILIGFSSRDLSAEYTAKLSEAIVDYAKTKPGVKLVMVDAQSDVQKQFSQVENFIAQKVDAIILNPCELEASTPAVDRIKAAGIPLVLVNQTTKSAGDSMEEAGIMDGDTVIICRTDTAENGTIVVALVDENEVTLKRLRRRGNSIALEPANARHETRIFGPDRVRVQGKLVGLLRRY